MQQPVNILAAICAATLVGCGGSATSSPPRVSQPATITPCLSASNGHGSMGECAPHAKLSVSAPRTVSGITYSDRSNNDPTYNMAAIRRAGHPGIVLKVNQGTGFLDGTFYYMAKAAQRTGLAVGGYDFDQNYTAAEVYTFIARLHAAGIYRSTPSTFPPTLDVEYGNANRAGLEHQLAVLFRVYGRASIYTGAWFYLPRFGCWIPPHVSFWLSGYPNAAILCGLAPYLFQVHQFSDHSWDGAGYADMNVWRGTRTGFAAFAQIASPKPKPNPRRAQLLHRRAVLRVLLTRHRCRTGHAKPARYRSACRTWLHEGAQVNREIRRTP